MLPDSSGSAAVRRSEALLGLVLLPADPAALSKQIGRVSLQMGTMRMSRHVATRRHRPFIGPSWGGLGGTWEA